MDSDFCKSAVHHPPHLWIGVPGFPERHGRFMVGLDLLRQHPDVSEFDAELIVAGTVFGVVRPHLLVAERFELVESFFKCHGGDFTRVSPV